MTVEHNAIEGRLRHLEEEMVRHAHVESSVVVRMEERMISMAAMLTKIETNMVTKAQFGPVRNVVFGLVALILTAVMVAWIGLVVR